MANAHVSPSFTDTERTMAWLTMCQKLGFNYDDCPVDPSHLYDVLTPIELCVLQDAVNSAVQACMAELASKQYKTAEQKSL